MRILGIDYGHAKIGLAISEGKLAEPYRVIRFEKIEDAVSELRQEVKKENIEAIVVGISEGVMGEESKNFGEEIKKTLGIKVNYQDETLTSFDANRLSNEAGIPRGKKRALEDAYAAASMLQSYLESKNV